MDKWIMLITALTNLTVATINLYLIVRKEKDANRGNGEHPEN
ncbi:hypothetical protein [Paenibacillus sp. HWE-109]|nr:hypothetical protein [Paenibacillus sp. HWE-109]